MKLEELELILKEGEGLSVLVQIKEVAGKWLKNNKYLKFVLISNLKLENCLFWEQENKGK